MLFERKKLYLCTRNQMVDVPQLVRVPDCGSVGRGFESHLPPSKRDDENRLFFLSINKNIETQNLKTSELFWSLKF